MIPTHSSSAQGLPCCLQVLAGAQFARKLLHIRYSADHGAMRQLLAPARGFDLAVDSIGSLAERTDV